MFHTGHVLLIVGMEVVLASTKVVPQTAGVKKDVELQYDLGNLLASDLNTLDSQSLRYVVNLCLRVHTYSVLYILSTAETERMNT